MHVTVEGPASYNGVSVEHPSIQSSIRNLIKQGRTNEDICRIIGMPQEVVDRVRTRLKKESK